MLKLRAVRITVCKKSLYNHHILSQAAACDGNYYQILLEGDNNNRLQEFSQIKPLGHSVRTATTNFILINMIYVI